MDSINNIKIIVKIIALTCALILLTSCKSADNVDVSMYDLSRSMLAASDEFKDMKYVSNEDENSDKLLKNVSDIEYSKVDKFFISYASDGGKNADEIVVIALKSSKDVPQAKSSLEKHCEYRKSLYSTYKPKEGSKFINAKTVAYKNIVCLIVADNSSAVEKAFYDFLKK